MISVVIPLYNKAHTIIETLDTVLNQSFQNFEIIIVNDGSTDNSIDVIKNFTKDKRIRIIKQDNQGVSVARNVGVKYAKFDYIAFLDGDDHWLPGYLSKFEEVIGQFPDAGMICFAGYVKDSQGEHLRLAQKYRGKLSRINFFENPHVFLHTSATIVSKQVFNKTQGFPIGMRRNQDYAGFFSIALITKVVYVGIPLSIYMGGVDGQATSTDLSQVREHVVHRFNHVYNNWMNTKPKNKLFKVFTMYEIRGLMKIFIRRNDYDTIGYFFDNLDPGIVAFFPDFERRVYSKTVHQYISILYIQTTKLRWRLRGYPRVNY